LKEQDFKNIFYVKKLNSVSLGKLILRGQYCARIHRVS